MGKKSGAPEWVKGKYGIIPKSIFTAELSLSAFRVYVALSTFAWKDDGIVFPKQKTLTDMLNISRQKLSKHLRELEDAGVIEVIRGRKGRGGAFTGNQYRLISPEPDEDEEDDSEDTTV